MNKKVKPTFMDWAEKALNEGPKNAKQIWEYAQRNGAVSGGKTPDATIGAVIYTDFNNNPDSVLGLTTDADGNRLFTKRNYKEVISDEKLTKDTDTYKKYIQESSLYPIFIAWLFRSAMRLSVRPVYGYRIDEKKSEKKQKGENQWMNPDIVAVDYLWSKGGNGGEQKNTIEP